MVVHGKRRAAEMREAAQTVAELGITNSMSRATVDWQQSVGDLGVNPKAANFYELTDSILEQIDKVESNDCNQSGGKPKWA
jgi:hypothetical protein